MKDQNKHLESKNTNSGTLSGLLPSLILILLGVLFLLSTFGLLKNEWWQYFLVCLGLILLVYTWIEYTRSEKKHVVFNRIIWGVILIGLGVVFLLNPAEWWPLILIAIGLILLVRFIFQRRPEK